jgi:hypothetical protein
MDEATRFLDKCTCLLLCWRTRTLIVIAAEANSLKNLKLEIIHSTYENLNAHFTRCRYAFTGKRHAACR